MGLSNLDADDFRLIVQIQLDEIRKYSESAKGKGKVGEETDFDIAVGEQERQLEHSLQDFEDACVARNTKRRELSVVQPGRRMTAPNSTASLGLEKLNIKTEDTPDQPDPFTPSGSLVLGDPPEGSEEPKPDSETVIECDTCGNCDRGFVVKCPCGHNYCGQCLQTLLNQAVVDESLFPPRCCKQEFTMELMGPFLTGEQIKTFNDKKIEFGTPNRTYCHQPSCSTFIPPSLLAQPVVTCDECGKKTCTICKEKEHEEDCPKDVATQEILRLAREMGWQRCFSCHRIVELKTGCNHISKSRVRNAFPS